jgi:hypothetical protein
MRAIVTTHMLIISRKKTDLICDFYGHTHPKCKKALNRDAKLYDKYVEQFKVPEEKKNDDSK